MPTPPLLSPLEARILGVLVEKQHTVPDTYPMTLNALTTGCNQKTSRDPVMNASESEVLRAIDRLRGVDLVIESSGGRVQRYEQNLRRVIPMPTEALALLATLALRGPQTAAELRQHAERLHRFADVSSVEAFLDEMAERDGGALVLRLPRAPGAREARWAHLLCGPVAVDATSGRADGDATGARPGPAGQRDDDGDTAWHALAADVDALRDEVRRLREEIAALRALVEPS